MKKPPSSRISQWQTLAMLLISSLLSSCSSPGAFRNVSVHQPHAVLVAEEVKFPIIFGGDYESLVRSINDQPVDFASVRNRFRVPPGPTVIQPEREDYPEWRLEPMHFTAVAGREYLLCPPLKGRLLELIEVLPGESEGKRIASCLWGASTSTSDSSRQGP